MFIKFCCVWPDVSESFYLDNCLNFILIDSYLPLPKPSCKTVYTSCSWSTANFGSRGFVNIAVSSAKTALNANSSHSISCVYVYQRSKVLVLRLNLEVRQLVKNDVLKADFLCAPEQYDPPGMALASSALDD